jgi:rifampicin phosphotransferase
MPDQPALVLPFAAVSAADLALVGGKGASLGEMARAGFPVPPGFCVTTAAFRRFVADCPGMADLYDALDALDPDNVAAARALGERLRGALAAVPVPEDIARAVAEAWRTVGPDHAYAVRSSATAEDLPGASFAGQQDSFLNVRGEVALIAAVRDCWASLFTDRAILYRARGGFGHRGVGLAVVVQRMIASEVSGILFTADPVSGHRHHAVIEAGFGLGEALVGGLITADRFTVDTRSAIVVDRRIADKALAIRPRADGGTERVALSGAEHNRPTLADEQVLALADLGTRIAAHYGVPQDIEFALAGGELFVVQSRPITTLFPLPEPVPTDGALHMYVSFGHVQVMPEALRPMARSAVNTLFSFGRGEDGRSQYLRTAGGRLYIDFTALFHHAPFRRVAPRMLTIVDTEIAASVGAVVHRPEFIATSGLATGQIQLASFARTMVPILARALSWLLVRDPAGAKPLVEAILEGRLAEAQAAVAAATTTAERLRASRATAGAVFPWLFQRALPPIMAGIGSRVAIMNVTAGRADPADVAALGRALPGNVTTEMDLAVGDLADMARAHPAVAAWLTAGDLGAVHAALAGLTGGPEFLAALDGFLARYGMRGPAEIDITRPRWRDDPAPILQVVAGNLGAEPGAHRRRHAALAAEGEAAVARVAASGRTGFMGVPREWWFGRLARVQRRLLALREHPKFFIIRTLDLLRSAVLAAADELVAAGRLGGREDVWFLTLDELAAALDGGGPDLASLVAARRAEHERDARRVPPRVLTSDGEIVSVRPERTGVPAGALSGTAASAGVAEGIARVVLDPAREVLRSGEILVAPFTDPGWTPLFVNAAGLVMEVGGLMTHGSVVAREYGIPAVVGVPDATRLIRTGQRVRVDGDTGVVEVLGGGETGG